jgi:hypothetical protein
MIPGYVLRLIQSSDQLYLGKKTAFAKMWRSGMKQIANSFFFTEEDGRRKLWEERLALMALTGQSPLYLYMGGQQTQMEESRGFIENRTIYPGLFFYIQQTTIRLICLYRPLLILE